MKPPSGAINLRYNLQPVEGGPVMVADVDVGPLSDEGWTLAGNIESLPPIDIDEKDEE